MRPIRILQVASFDGNVGDNANHNGTRRLLQSNLGRALSFTDWEIRETYWHRRAFDESFAELCNEHDLVIFGGGNFFELWVESSATGTSIDIATEVLHDIRVPVCFYALGCDDGMGVPSANVARFRKFLNWVLGSEQFLVSVRNDGSYATLAKHIGGEYAERIHRVPDGGFFVEPGERPPIIPVAEPTLGINIAGDMLERRFPGGADHITYPDFARELGEVLFHLLSAKEDLQLLFFPHIFRDLAVIANLLEVLPDPVRRRRVSVAPYLSGPGSEELIFGLYEHCAGILGMRFHANVCPIGLGIPTLGLSCYPQVAKLYAELELENQVVTVNRRGFASDLLAGIDQLLDPDPELESQRHALQIDLRAEVDRFHRIMRDWLVSQLGV